MDFIPSDESPLFIKGFRIYTYYLFKRRFSKVWLKQEYQPDNSSKTIYYLNHHSWWDGLIPFLLNEYIFHQRARAVMGIQQMQKYSFFKKIGAFSINRNDQRQTLRSLRYAVESFERPNASLFIYPQGEITPPGSSLHFEKGLAWLSQQLTDIEIVPIGIYIHTVRNDKPELHLWIGPSIKTETSHSKQELTQKFENKLENILEKLRETAGFDDSIFERFI
ncbi:lysophospholipid acyltransferase family protein [Aliifodinibius salicampi]|uniref:Lysophospholipid acyltransferase family protein n=1 Tax=Fodinibius salicampi TaxID=1920655 RepID=A0ABT3PWY2_9BACT|nr:lysophospholipid acyltransferase family protein [Fodinibius salicampi]MCW9712360.1 lysophospholipid acyltransferase family protein [Fodinibius salicampi]